MERTTKNYISLYNTVGLIEKDKNIYFVPHQADIYAKRTAQRTKVCDCYMELFNTVLSFSSIYNNLEISSWTPEDRQLCIDGTVDDFRQSRGRGLALNYIIVKREVTDTDSNTSITSHYYFAYFIDSVEQLGLNSVRLSVTPDYFTNLYYLNNDENITEDYDPFNSIMKNCFIERQHYNRFKDSGKYKFKSFTSIKANTWFRLAENIVGSVTLPAGATYHFKIVKSNGETYSSFTEQVYKNNTNSPITCYNIVNLGTLVYAISYLKSDGTIAALILRQGCHPVIKFDVDTFTVTNGFILEELETIFEYDNLKRILGSEEVFSYKYQYKNKYEVIPIGMNIDEDNLSSIYSSLKSINTQTQFNNYISSLSLANKKIVMSIFISYINIIFKENILFPISYDDPSLNLGTDHFISYLAGRCKYGDVSSPLTHCVLPFVSIPYNLQNIKKEWFKFFVGVKYNSLEKDFGYLYDAIMIDYNRGTEVLNYLTTIGASQYILTNFISKYSPIENDVTDISVVNSYVRIKYTIDIKQSVNIDSNINSVGAPIINLDKNSFAFLPDSIYPFEKSRIITGDSRYLANSLSNHSNKPLFTIGENDITINTIQPTTYTASGSSHYLYGTFYGLIETEGIQQLLGGFVFVLGNNSFKEQTFTLSDRLKDKNIKDIYIDPITESDPYSFYSLSIYQTEQIISKVRLIDSYNNGAFVFKLQAIISFNDSYKVGLILSYNIDGAYKRYYSESIVTTIASQIPIIEDSWINYYSRNKAQMKNQYAVQQNNFESGMAQQGYSTIENIGNKSASGAMRGGGIGAIVGAVEGALSSAVGFQKQWVANKYQVANIELSQKAKMADMGAVPDTVKLAGSDVLYDAIQNDKGFHINHYSIDEVSYNSICKYLERFGYQINIFDSMNIFNRVGLNFLKVTSFDYVEDNFVLSEEQMNAVNKIFASGVTLLHDKNYLHNLGETGYHNIETAIKEVN